MFMISSADFMCPFLGGDGRISTAKRTRGRRLNRGLRRGKRRRVGQIPWPSAGSFHVRDRAPSWPSLGSLSWPPTLRERVRDLTARETQCCSFFTFVISGTDQDLTLDISVPPAKQEILDALAERASELSA